MRSVVPRYYTFSKYEESREAAEAIPLALAMHAAWRAYERIARRKKVEISKKLKLVKDVTELVFVGAVDDTRWQRHVEIEIIDPGF